MAQDYRLKIDDVMAATEGGKAVILHFYPQSAAGFSSKRNFKIRDDDKNPSCTVFQRDGVWLMQDKGGADTKACNAVGIVMREEGLTFPQALEWIAQKFAPQLLEGSSSYSPTKPAPIISEVPPQDSISVQVRESGEFTEKELKQLGYKITPEVCDELCLKPVDFYVTARNAKGKSYKIASTENYPIYYYDYGSWGKIYQPLGDLRFLYAGQKPDNFIFGEKDFIENFTKARAGEFVAKVQADPDDELSETVDLTWQELVICSGPSDALNVKNAGYHVCWLNSETAELNEYDYTCLCKLAKKIYILYDNDETGITNMYRIAFRYLDINIIKLPQELSKFRTRSGKPCKDAKDFFVHFRRPESQDPHKLFRELVKLSGSLKFWIEKKTPQGKFSGYDINNEQLYPFLQASGYYRIPSTATKKGYTFCHIDDNIVTLIDEDAISSHCSGYLLEYIKSHPMYYNQTLANAIHRSKQITKPSLEKLKMIEPDFRAYDETTEHVFFRNAIVRITAKGVQIVKPSECQYMVYRDKILDHDFKPTQPFFDIEYTEEYATLRNRLAVCPPDSPAYAELRKQVDTLEDAQRYRLRIFRNDCSFGQFVYDTGRLYWRKEELGLPLTQEEQAETDLHFISKVMALGYLLSKHKNQGQPYAVYAMEIEESEEGQHQGGTGKSLFMTAVEQMRKMLFINGQELRTDKMEFMLQGVVKGVTDNVYFDDLNEMINLHRFMPMITGKMVVNAKYADAFILDFKDSPKVAFTSNHAIKGFDASLRRRTWFSAFSDYYHPDAPMRGLQERSPLTKFGKNLIQDYTPEEMNDFYNFMMNCMQVWMKLRVRIQPPMKQIEKRNLQRVITDEFLWWAEDYFSEEKLNVLYDIAKALEDYRATLPKKFADTIKPQTFKNRLINFCAYKEWTFNPKCLLTTTTDMDRNRIHKKENGQDVYYFYIDTTGIEDLDVKSILGKSPRGEGGGEPIDIDIDFGNDDEDAPPF